MRVLDVGSGAGDCAFAVAELVGASGEVVGTDRVTAAVATAAKRAEAKGLRNVSFRAGDPAELTFAAPFDAVVGRYVLWCQADPAAMLAKLARQVRPGGIVAFHEMDWYGTRSSPVAPTYDRCCQWLREVFRATESDVNMASRLYPAFVAAGLPAPSLRMRAFLGGAAESREFLVGLAELLVSLAATLERLGIATAAEVGVETLADRLQREVTELDCAIIGRAEIGAWSRV